MNTSQGALYFGAGIDLNQWRRDVDSMRRDIVGLTNTTVQQTRQMDSAFKNLSVGIAGYFSIGAIKSFVTELINVRGEFQKTEIAFSTMLGNGEQAKALMNQMITLAAKTPFSLQDVSAGAKQLLAFQIPADQVVDTLTRMGNIAAGLGVPLSRINLVYGQVKAKGKLMGDDLRQFTEAGIPMLAELAKKFGKNTTEIQEMVSAGKIGFKDVKDVLFSLTNEGGMFFNLMEKQSKSLSGQIANLGDAWDQMLNKIGEANDSILSDGIAGLTYLVEHYEGVLRVLTTIIAAYGTYRAVLIAVDLAQKSMAVATFVREYIAMSRALGMATANMIAFNTATLANPLTLAAVGIAAVVAGLVYFNTGTKEAKNNAELMAQAVNAATASVGKESLELNKLYKAATEEKNSRKERTEAVKELQRLYPSYFSNLSQEIIMTGKAKANYDELREAIVASARARAIGSELERREGERLAEEVRLQEKLDEATRIRNENLKKGYKDKAISIGGGSSAGGVASGQTYTSTAAQQAENDLKRQKEAQKNLQAFRNKSLNEDEFYINKKIELDAKAGKYNKDKEGAGEMPVGARKGTQGWYEEEIKRLQEENKGLDLNSKKRQQNLALIEKYGELLNPKKAKEDNQQIAEILPFGSPKQIQQQIQLLDEAMEMVSNGMVKIRKLDKYGNDKDKKGNPYLTGEIISLEEAGKRKEALEEKQKSLQYKNFQERIDESERQWNNYYKMAEFYGKETADAQYKDLFKGSQSYLQYLEKEQQALEDKQSGGGILSEKDKNNIIFLQDKINSLNGTETPLENFKRGIENAVKTIPSLVDQLDYLEKAQDDAFNKEGSNSSLFLQEKTYLEQRKKDVLQSQRDLYNDFLKEQETFESKKLTIEQKYNDIRKKIGEDTSYSDSDRLRLLDTAAKEEAKEYSDAFLNVFKKTKLWEKAFGDIDSLTKKEISQLIPVLEAQISQLIKLDAPIAEIEGFRKKLEELKTFSTGSNPITRLIANFKELRKRIKEGTATQADFERLRNNVNEVAVYVRMATDAAKELSEALGIGNKGGPFEKFAKDLTQTIEGLINAIVGYFTGNMQQMVGGIIQMVVGVIKMLSTAGDGRKEKSIRAWKRAVDDLKFAYEELQMIIEKTAGEGQLAMQRDLISNLKEQQRILQEMRSKESAKKKADQEKIAGFTQQINDINLQIQQLIDDFQTSVTTIEFKDFSKKIADALIEAFGKGEDAAASFEKVVDDVMRNAVANALRIKILEPAVKSMVDSLYSSMGFGGTGGATSAQANQLKSYQDQIAEIDKKLLSANSMSANSLNMIKTSLLEQIKILQQQIASNAVSGSFDGLTQEERDKIKTMGEDAMKKYMEALKQYEELFGASAENAQGLKGDIKGITEKTAGTLEAQFNAVRINIVAIFKLMQQNHTVSNAQTVLLSQIEVNTRNLHQMRKDLAEMNSKIKPGLAGIP